VHPLWKSVRSFLKNLKINIHCDPVIPLLDIYLKEHKSAYKRDNCISMFIAAFFTIAKLWKLPRCPTANEWIKKKIDDRQKDR
jgi:hypothetical protein